MPMHIHALQFADRCCRHRLVMHRARVFVRPARWAGHRKDSQPRRIFRLRLGLRLRTTSDPLQTDFSLTGPCRMRMQMRTRDVRGRWRRRRVLYPYRVSCIECYKWWWHHAPCSVLSCSVLFWPCSSLDLVAQARTYTYVPPSRIDGCPLAAVADIRAE